MSEKDLKDNEALRFNHTKGGLLMVRKITVLISILLMLFAAGACKKKEETKPIVPRNVTPGQPGPVPGHQTMLPQGETAVVVPDLVQGNWKGVVLVVENKATNKTQEYKVDLNSEMTIPDSRIKISVGEFMPDFKMEGLTITSVSNEPNNPAVGVSVSEDGKKIFPVSGRQWGWLYAKFPDIHPFDHPTYSIKLKEGLKKG
jgi:hypothetical protein